MTEGSLGPRESAARALTLLTVTVEAEAGIGFDAVRWVAGEGHEVEVLTALAEITSALLETFVPEDPLGPVRFLGLSLDELEEGGAQCG